MLFTPVLLTFNFDGSSYAAVTLLETRYELYEIHLLSIFIIVCVAVSLSALSGYCLSFEV